MKLTWTFNPNGLAIWEVVTIIGSLQITMLCAIRLIGGFVFGFHN